MQELWEDFGERYKVSNFGNVDSLNYRGRGKRKRLISCINNTKGYMRVGLSFNGTEKKYTVHRLVAICFIPNPNNYKQVNHIDGNKLNNHVSNLEWCSHQQNMRKAWELGLYQPKYGEKHVNAKIKEADVIEIFRLYNIVGWLQQRIADHFGINVSTVSGILRRKFWKHVEIK
jgi:hypothetical protein